MRGLSDRTSQTAREQMSGAWNVQQTRRNDILMLYTHSGAEEPYASSPRRQETDGIVSDNHSISGKKEEQAQQDVDDRAEDRRSDGTPEKTAEMTDTCRYNAAKPLDFTKKIVRRVRCE